jgi:hypothetical protein
MPFRILCTNDSSACEKPESKCLSFLLAHSFRFILIRFFVSELVCVAFRYEKTVMGYPPILLLKAQQMAATRTRLVAVQKATSDDLFYTFSSRAQKADNRFVGKDRLGRGAF